LTLFPLGSCIPTGAFGVISQDRGGTMEQHATKVESSADDLRIEILADDMQLLDHPIIGNN